MGEKKKQTNAPLLVWCVCVICLLSFYRSRRIIVVIPQAGHVVVWPSVCVGVNPRRGLSASSFQLPLEHQGPQPIWVKKKKKKASSSFSTGAMIGGPPEGG